MPKTKTSVQEFINKATTLWNGLNAHPDQLDIYGTNLLNVAVSIGTLGLKIVIKSHLFLTDKASSRLLWTSSKQRITTKRTASGKVRADVGFPNKTDPKDVRKPKLSEIRNCFYKIFVVAIFPLFSDKSRLTPSQIRFLMRLSGLKIRRASDIIDGLHAMLMDLNRLKVQAGKPVQDICSYLPIILRLIDKDKANAFIHVMQAVMLGKCVSITPRADYLAQIHRLPKSKITMPRQKVPNERFVAVLFNLQCRRVTANDLKKIARTFIYYLS